MIKQHKKITLIKNYKLESYNPIVIPTIIKEKDIYSMFSGLLSLVKEMATAEAKKTQIHKDASYTHLLKMYVKAVREMNRYKALYLKSLKLAK